MKYDYLHRCRGFSMVEVVLAVLILGVGVLSVLGLMSGGLQMSKGGLDETQVTTLANDVLESLQGSAAVATNPPPLRDQIRTLAFPLAPAAAVMWDRSVPKIQECAALPPAFKLGQPGSFCYIPRGTNTMVDFACRYRLQINAAPLAVSGSSAVRSRVAAIRMDVQPGAFGQTATQCFYREMFQFVK
ncbi:MAG: prepilin-type N-terminal cleavage/methylation domain-containing protein [Verrucomicrobia bacterium]|nr:MAG: prepilin-type N-terminal cleavage/methylation domain-containing protein [Verrucomicrobiota bacterium]